MSCVRKAPFMMILSFPTLLSDAVKICVGKSHRELLLLPMQVRSRWQKLWKTFPDTIWRRSENWRWEKSYFRCIFRLRWQKSQRIATFTNTNKTALAKVVENIHWLQQRFPLKECESFANACFPTSNAIMRWQLFCILAMHRSTSAKPHLVKFFFAKIIWVHRFNRFDLFPSLCPFHVFFYYYGGNYNSF